MIELYNLGNWEFGDLGIWEFENGEHNGRKRPKIRISKFKAQIQKVECDFILNVILAINMH